MKKNITDIQSLSRPIVCLTAYTALIAQIADKHCDLLLVGDSVSMVLYGHDTTRKADMEMMVRHGKAVANNAQNAVVVIDMPFGSYDSKEMALDNAKWLLSETGGDAVKLEGGTENANIISFLVANDIQVMGHIGLLPQSAETPADYKVQGREVNAAKKIMNDALAVEKAGAFCFVIEAVPEPLAAAITGQAKIPTIGIGASNACDGQILVTEDMLGLTTGRPPKFVKQYTQLNALMCHAIGEYADEVKQRAFPASENTYYSEAACQIKKTAKNQA